MTDRVKSLQLLLADRGFKVGKIDGDYGSKTAAALAAYQVQQGGTSRVIRKIVVHCTATREGQHVTATEIRRWHLNQGWSDIGYHYVHLLDGSIQTGRPEATVGSHVQGHNTDSIGITYVGGVASNGQTPKDTRTAQQKESLRSHLRTLAARYPFAVIVGHRDLSPDKDGDGRVEPHEYLKACPSFDAPAEYRELETLS